LSPIGDAVAKCKGLTSEVVGTRLGVTVSDIARAFVDAGAWNEPDCTSPKTQELRHLCALVDDLYNAVELVNKAVDRGCIEANGPYDRSPDHYAFEVVEALLSSPNPRIRWQGLMRMFVLCDEASMLTEAGAKGCGPQVEQGALTILKTDKDLFDRHLALEVLGSRFLTEASRPILEDLVRTAQDIGPDCPHGWLSDSAVENPVAWEAMADGFAKSQYSCERMLAADALRKLDSQKSQTGDLVPRE
jgi:hypothetical protein